MIYTLNCFFIVTVLDLYFSLILSKSIKAMVKTKSINFNAHCFVVACSFVLLMASNVFAQPTSIGHNKNPYKWMFGLSWSVVDDNGKPYTRLLDVVGSYNFEYYPSRITVDRYLKKGWSLELAFAYNMYKGSKLINGVVGVSGIFLSTDIHAKYSFYKFMSGRKRLEPYLSIGLGGTYRTTQNPTITPTVNLALGANYWFNQNWGAQIQTNGKVGVLPAFYTSSSNYIQHTIGVVYRMDERKKNRSDFDKRRYPWAHDKKKYKRKNT